MDAFLRALWADPESVPLRQAFADFLDEQGDPRADAVRGTSISPGRHGVAGRRGGYLSFHFGPRRSASEFTARFPMPGMEPASAVKTFGLLSDGHRVLMPCPQEAARA